jgi:phosphoenolpyruvate synthase/pyruvate phosphate dikinase
VWASPSTERAFGWRQGLMDLPEHVYASVLLHRSVAADKSGVMVTANLDTGARDEITVVTNTGVAGGVDGQAAETLVISLETGAPRLRASATARTKRVLAAEGGARQVASDAPESVLSPDEIRQLVAFVRAFPKDYPGLQDEHGRAAPADIEFGFVAGHLMLLQIRPFVQSAQVSQNQYLMDLDAGLRKTGGRWLDLDAVPAAAS